MSGKTIYIMEINLKRTKTISALMLAGMIASPALVYAQTNPTVDPAVVDTTTVDDRDDHSNWGWLGLLGLAGLLGLKRPQREREMTHDQTRTRQTV